MADYSFVVNSAYNPFTLQEMLVPYQLYGEAFNKAEEQAIELQKNADEFSYLADTLEEGSKARALYEGFAKDLRSYSDDLSANGLSISNRRGIANMRRRYSGEIGRLKKADDAMQEERTRRLNLSSNDPTMLYATDNLSIDDFLDRKEPNRYNVSGQKLYERGIQIGTSGSSRIYGDPRVQQLTEKYNNIIQDQGYSPQLIAMFRDDLSAIPEFQRSVDSTLKEFGVTDNLTGANYERARQSVINGIVNGITYQKKNTINQDPDYITTAQKKDYALKEDSMNLQAAAAGYKKENDKWVYDPELDPAIQKLKYTAAQKGITGTGSGSGSGSTGDSEYVVRNTKPLIITWQDKSDAIDSHGKTKGDNDKISEALAGGKNSLMSLLSKEGKNYTVTPYKEGDDYPGQLYSYDDLPYDVKIVARMHMAADDVPENYLYSYRPYKDNSFFFGDDLPQLGIFPGDSQKLPKVESAIDPSLLYGITGAGAGTTEAATPTANTGGIPQPSSPLDFSWLNSLTRGQ